MRATRKGQADRLEALERRMRDQLAALDERVAGMTVREFFERYAADEARAAREAVEAAVTHKPMIDEETVGRSRSVPVWLARLHTPAAAGLLLLDCPASRHPRSPRLNVPDQQR